VGADPQAVAFGADGDQDGAVFACSAVEAGLRDVERPSFLLAGMGGGLVERLRLAGFDRQCAGGTDGQAKAGPVTQVFADDTGFAVDQLDGPLGAGGNTQTAAIAQAFVDLDYRPDRFPHSKNLHYPCA